MPLKKYMCNSADRPTRIHLPAIISEANEDKPSYQTKISDKSLQWVASIIVKFVFHDVKHTHIENPWGACLHF